MDCYFFRPNFVPWSQGTPLSLVRVLGETGISKNGVSFRPINDIISEMTEDRPRHIIAMESHTGC